MRITRPASLAEAAAMIAAGGVPVAGGTAFQLMLAQGVALPPEYVPVGHLIPKGLSAQRIGAGATLEDIRAADVPLLSQALGDVAAPNIRRLATIGGHVAWGKGCAIPALMALEAVIETTLGRQPIRDYLNAPKGILLALEIAPLSRVFWRKVGLRAGFSPAIITLAASMQVCGGTVTAARLAIGGGATPPQRLSVVEDWLIGQHEADIDPKAIGHLVADSMIAPDCQLRSGAYRRHVAATGFAHFIRPQTIVTKPRLLVHKPTTTVTEVSRSAQPDRWHIRPDMPAKVRGALEYLTDVRRPDMLVGRILRAGRPHARILSIDTTRAEALAGVKAVVTHRDITGLNGFGIVFQDQPALCADKVRYTGDAVAAVAAIDTATAEAALALIDVVYQDLPVVDDPVAALRAGAEPVHAAGNLVTTIRHQRGDLGSGWADAVHIVEETYRTPRQMHGFMETEGGWAMPEGSGLRIHAGGQHGARDRMQLARILGLPETAITVVTSPVGGAFGGKDELTVQPALALLARKAGAPVRIHLSRAESLIAGTKRNPMTIRMRTGCDATGRLVAQEVDVIADAGAYASLGPGVLETAMEHVAGPYIIPHLRAEGRLAYTNNGTCGAFRGFGANQMTFAIECQMDRLATLVGLDPIAMRRLNLRRAGSPGFLGQRVAPSERLGQMLDASAASDLWSPATVASDEVVGTGMALNHQGNGLGTIPEDEGRLALSVQDGKIVAACGLDEMGQGMIASVHAAVADALGCGRDDVRVVFGDTEHAPDAGSTTASRGGYVVWKGVQDTAPALAQAILTRAAAICGFSADQLTIVMGGVGLAERNDPAPLVTFAALGDIAAVTTHFAFPKTDYTAGNARYIFASGATLARVAVSRVTGQVRVLDLEMHTAAGPVIDLASYLGQMEGGLVQGLGFTLTEDMPMRSGEHLLRNLDGYMMPTVMDTADRIRVTADESLDAGDPYGPRGAGEIGIGAVSPAIAAAIADATGHWPTALPVDPSALALAMKGAR